MPRIEDELHFKCSKVGLECRFYNKVESSCKRAAGVYPHTQHGNDNTLEWCSEYMAVQ